MSEPMTMAEKEKFCKEWTEACEMLRRSGVDLSKIIITTTMGVYYDKHYGDTEDSYCYN